MYDFRIDRGQGQEQDSSGDERDVPIHLQSTVVRNQVKEGRREGRSTHKADNREENLWEVGGATGQFRQRLDRDGTYARGDRVSPSPRNRVTQNSVLRFQ